MTTPEKTITLPVHCHNEDCGMVSAYQFWRDGSYRRILEACGHSKKMPTREKLAKALQESLKCQEN